MKVLLTRCNNAIRILLPCLCFLISSVKSSDMSGIENETMSNSILCDSSNQTTDVKDNVLLSLREFISEENQKTGGATQDMSSFVTANIPTAPTVRANGSSSASHNHKRSRSITPNGNYDAPADSVEISSENFQPTKRQQKISASQSGASFFLLQNPANGSFVTANIPTAPTVRANGSSSASHNHKRSRSITPNGNYDASADNVDISSENFQPTKRQQKISASQSGTSFLPLQNPANGSFVTQSALTVRPKVMRTNGISMRPVCASPLGSCLNTLSRIDPASIDKLLIFSSNGRTQVVAVMVIVSVFLDGFNQNQAEGLKQGEGSKIFFSDVFSHIIGFSSGGIPAASVALGSPFDKIINKLSQLPASSNVGISSIVSSPGWMIAKGLVTGFFNSKGDEYVSMNDNIKFPVVYDVFNYRALYQILIKFFGKKKRDDAIRNLYIHAGSTNSRVKDQIMEGINQYDSKHAIKNANIAQNELLDCTKTAAKKMGLDSEKIDKIAEFLDKPENFDQFVSYEEIMKRIYSGEFSKDCIILSFSARTSTKSLDMSVSPTIKGGIAHIDFCMGIPESMYKEKIVNVSAFKDKARQFLSENKGALEMTQAIYGIMNRYLSK